MSSVHDLTVAMALLVWISSALADAHTAGSGRGFQANKACQMPAMRGPAMTKPTQYSFDPTCLSLAEYFLSSNFPTVPVGLAHEMAQRIQDAVEDYLKELETS